MWKDDKAAGTVECSNWMGQHRDMIARFPISSLAIAGSHNSGSYAIHGSRPQRAWDCDPSIARYFHLPGFPTIVRRWAKCQTSSIRDQLLNGIRYLDVRLSCDTDNGRMFLCHAVCFISFDDFCTQLIDFSDSHPSEIILVDVNHVYVDPNAPAHSWAIKNHYHTILDRLIEAIGRNRIVDRECSPSTTISKILEARPRIILIFDNAEAAESRHIWGPDTITSAWPNSNKMTRVLDHAVLECVSNRDASRLHVMQLLLTCKPSDIAKNIYGNLINHSRRLTYHAPQFIFEQCRKDGALLRHFNVVIMDDCCHSNGALALAAIEINLMKYESMAYPPIYHSLHSPQQTPPN
uniref:Phosphatidylinositol-specific phospholipase C X domain-containing protein n=1 Tax=Spongospora subterranea TaxID=70186 RepID=A0A0H5RMI2_9EUKA|eukprot:CRZ09929.1 hypothetical protein [Spongospora subterranea]